CYVVHPDSVVKSFADLNNPDLVYLGYTGLANGTMFHEKYPDTGMQTISPPPGYAPRVPEVLKGRGDIAALDSPLAFWVSKRWPQARIVPEPEDCLKNPDLVRPIGIGYTKGDEVFAQFLAEVVAANQEEIDASTLQFSQPEWLDSK